MQSADPPVRMALAWALRNPLEILAGAMLVAICAIVFAGVFFRYFLQIGLGWTEEAARYLQVWMTFVGATVAVRRWSHFQLALVNAWIPHGARRYVEVFAIVVVMILSGVMIKHGIEITRYTWTQTSPIMEWNIGYLYLVVPLSGTLMLLFAIRHLLVALRRGSDASGGAPALTGGDTE